MQRQIHSVYQILMTKCWRQEGMAPRAGNLPSLQSILIFPLSTAQTHLALAKKKFLIIEYILFTNFKTIFLPYAYQSGR